MPRTLRLFAPPKRVLGPLLVIFVVLVVLVPLLSSLGWILGQSAFSRTTGIDFCITCHSMEPMAESYRNDVHGGRSRYGVRASCSDCHLPGDNSLDLIWSHWKRIIGDTWVELIHGSSAIDWEGLRGERESYVFDSGCLNCHSNLLQSFPRNSDAFAAHTDYFNADISSKCVTCHSSVGHKELGDYLSKGS